MALLIENLKVRRSNFTLEVPRLIIERGECLGISGQSGSGKSTLLEAVAGFLPVEAGDIRIEGQSLLALPPEQRRVAMVFQKSFLFANLSVLENVSFAYRVRGIKRPEREAQAMLWLDRLKVSDLAKRRVHQISGGQAQRVALARALATQFPVLLLDEPFSALDSELRGEMRELVRKLVAEEKIASLMVSHDPKDFPGKSVTVKDGRIAL